MGELQGLLERVEAAPGPDRELDLFIWRWEHGFNPFKASFSDNKDPIYPVTTSLEASLALVERVLPTFTVDLTIYRTNGGEFRPRSVSRLFCPYGEISEHRGDASTPALALLSAMLKALIAKAPDHG